MKWKTSSFNYHTTILHLANFKALCNQNQGRRTKKSKWAMIDYKKVKKYLNTYYLPTNNFQMAATPLMKILKALLCGYQ